VSSLSSKSISRAAPEQRYHQQRHDARFALLLGFLSFLALLIYYGRHELLLYGDAVAHINIARRVLDNRRPIESLGQLGTVWLPLQHIAMLPFVWSKALWQSGIAGAIPCMVAYILSVLGIFRLVCGRGSKVTAYFAAAIYALNPNLLYLQSTAMNEPIMLAFFIWAVVYLDEFLRASFPSQAKLGAPARTPPERALEACGVVIAGGALTRYDGWFLATVVGVIITGLFAAWWRLTADQQKRRRMTKSFAEFLLLNAMVPAFWLLYTRNVSGRAFDFLNGPYSAMAIALRTTQRGAPPYPGQHDWSTAALYFLKSAKLNVGPGAWGQILFTLAVAGTIVALWNWRRYGTLALLWLPLPFYAFSIAYGSVPIFLPVWYPFSYYNVRYGLELLPVFAVFPSMLVGFAAQRLHDAKAQAAVWTGLAILVAGSYAAVYRETPITLREGHVNSRARISMETALANFLAHMPRSATLLMYESEHVGALQQANISLRRVVSEAAHPDWEWALLDPARHADVIIACQGDPVWFAVRDHRADLEELLAITAPEQGRCTIYRPK
jgi:4-amino-4-deoxy-L-arabinose transferase-like glycosyltransferase